MRTFVLFLISIFFATSLFAQKFDMSEYPKGTTTISALKQKYTLSQIKSMLYDSEIYRHVSIQDKIGIGIADPNTLEKIIVCDTDCTLLMFEYVNKLRQEITTLKTRLQAAGIP